jgi:hypothetical protein
MREKPTNATIIHSVYVAPTCFGITLPSSGTVPKHNTPSPNVRSTAPQLNTSQTAIGTLPEDGNVMPKHVGATIHN